MILDETSEMLSHSILWFRGMHTFSNDTATGFGVTAYRVQSERCVAVHLIYLCVAANAHAIDCSFGRIIARSFYYVAFFVIANRPLYESKACDIAIQEID